MAIGGVFTAAMPIVGSILAFGSPLIALVGIILGGIAHSRVPEMKGVSIAGLILSIIGFVLGLLVAMTCGLCNACVTAGAAGTAGAAQGFSNAGNDPIGWLPPPDPNAGAPAPSPAPPSDQRAPIEGETAPPVPVADILEHLNRTCHDAWCAPTNRDYLFTHVSCNGSECAIQFTGYHFDHDLQGPFQGRVRIPREAVQSDARGSVVPEPLDAALSPELESWVPAGSLDDLQDTTHPELRFVAWADSMCPDGWCEGALSYDYEHVRCETDECTLYFRWGDYDADTDGYRWVPGEITVPRTVVDTLPDDDGTDADGAFETFMELTGEFTAAHVD